MCLKTYIINELVFNRFSAQGRYICPKTYLNVLNMHKTVFLIVLKQTKRMFCIKEKKTILFVTLTAQNLRVRWRSCVYVCVGMSAFSDRIL